MPLAIRRLRPLSLSHPLLQLFLLLLVGLTTGCVSLPGGLGSRTTNCLPDFSYADGWLGGDSVYSIPVPTGKANHETIWVFGDSYVGKPGARDRVGSALIHNSVARSSCSSDGSFEIEYSWKLDTAGAPKAVFDAQHERHHVWPFDGFFLDDTLYVLLLEIGKKVTPGALGLPISIEGTLLARIENPEDPIAYWRVETRPITHDRRAIASTSAWVERGFVYLMAARNDGQGTHPRFLVRLPIESIEAWPDELGVAAETFTNRGAWEPGIHPANARILMHDNATEMSLDRDEEAGRYFVVYSAPLQTADDGTPSRNPELDAASIFTRTSISLTGPWSSRQRIYVMPGSLERSDENAEALEFCYAAKAHAEHSPPEIFVVTYVCNLAAGPRGDTWGTLEAMQSRMDVYRPRVVTYPRPRMDELEPQE